eukprot:CAMPEP_0114578322 /NCGR_PEP_ID=MMETSP0125-20121206/2879_1 /TAXON_ID=485358 ORGANISM="Aristerostoma sp., Strain ATCC 50986" /NCGR_SAMPLE_ID=MMETSP0125 /ASSEMBLY_ACC=CAM_ASM_000245 /LENGTH=205 /DNA_ID=CAMNT_0001768311 /DNA_START=50 /DNA_END=667 /DNA_ORIENTATION=-
MPYEYINLDPKCPMGEKLLSKKSATKFNDFSQIITIQQFIQGARKAFNSHLDDKEYHLFEDKMKNLTESYKARIESFRIAFWDVFRLMAQRVEELIDSQLQQADQITKGDFLEKVSQLEHPLPSYDPHSICFTILKGLEVYEDRAGFNFKRKPFSNKKASLNLIEKEAHTKLKYYDRIVESIDRSLKQLREACSPTVKEISGNGV